jgi:geranylgeranyl diphosphate synthase type I
MFHDMLTYHMGWTGEGAGPGAGGKRLRPLLLLLVFSASAPAAPILGALPAAAAVELVHNFSLVHDDIQDNSPRRRGRPTLWNIWGIPMAINAGDALFVMAGQAVLNLTGYPPTTVLEAARILHDTCLDLTRGQFLDMAYEERADLTVDDYWLMSGAKTAALLSACARIGALLGSADETRMKSYAAFGYDLGLAFQAQDDILGIWGNEAATGKSAASDLVEGKNSLPILYGMSRNAGFAARWKQGPILSSEVAGLAQLLQDEGAYGYAQERASYWTREAMYNLEAAEPQGEAGAQLVELANQLLGRAH